MPVMSNTNLALRYLKTYTEQHWQGAPEIILLEWTINDQVLPIVQRLYRQNADIYAFSCYIWNIGLVLRICSQLKKVCPNAVIILGGPEATFDAALRLEKENSVDLIIRGEGEASFLLLLEALNAPAAMPALHNIPGLVWRDPLTGLIQINPDGPLLDASEWVFPYSTADLAELKNRIIYYETSRGCPFRCSYCLSALDRTVRHRPLPQVFFELDQLIAADVQQVKLVDRTFNCQPQRALQIWQYLLDRLPDIGRTNFHFELAGDLLDDQAVDLLNQAPPGLFQLEIGVQSIHADVLRAINRPAQIDQMQNQVGRLRQAGRVHLHLDLIAGLPGETIDQVSESVNWVLSLRPQQFQLGFLKVLPGSPIRQMAIDRGFLWQDDPPYEILQSDALSFDDLIKLKNIEKMLDLYYNSGLFDHVLFWLTTQWESPYRFLAELAEWAEENQYLDRNLGSQERSQLIWQFALAKTPALKADFWLSNCFRDLIRYDYVLGGQKDQPDWLGFWENSHDRSEKSCLQQAKTFYRQLFPDCRRCRIDRLSFDWRTFIETGKFGRGDSILFFDLSGSSPRLLDNRSLNDLY